MTYAIYITLEGGTKEAGTLSDVRIEAQRERDPTWRKRLNDAAKAVEAALAGDPEPLRASGCRLRIVEKRDRFANGGFGLAAATFDALPDCVSWEC